MRMSDSQPDTFSRCAEWFPPDESLFRALAENAVIGVYLICQNRFLYVNTKLAQMLGYSREEMDDKLLKCFWGLSGGRTITFFVSLVVSMVIKGRMEDKKSMREAILPCISKLIILVIVLWLVF